MTSETDIARRVESLFRDRTAKTKLLERKLRKTQKVLRKTENAANLSRRILINIRQSRAYSEGVNRIMALNECGAPERYLYSDPVHRKLAEGFLGFYGDWHVAPSADTSLRVIMRYRQMPAELYNAIKEGDIEQSKKLYDKFSKSFYDFCVKNVWWGTFEEDLPDGCLYGSGNSEEENESC